MEINSKPGILQARIFCVTATNLRRYLSEFERIEVET